MPFTSEQTQHFNYKMNVADNKLVQDPQQLHAVAMLMDCSNGTIVNAAMAKVADATGIATPSTTKQESQTIYDLQGRRIITPARHGIYIVNGKKIAMQTQIYTFAYTTAVCIFIWHTAFIFMQ